MLCLASQPVLPEPSHQEGGKVKDIERENRVLKELLCGKNKKNVKIQTEKEGKF